MRIIKSTGSLKEKMQLKEEGGAELDHMEDFRWYTLKNVFCHISPRTHKIHPPSIKIFSEL